MGKFGLVVDLFCAGVVLLNFILGMIRGAVKEILNFVGIIVASVVAIKFYVRVGKIFTDVFNWLEVTGRLAGFFVILIGLLLAFKLLSFLINKLIKTSPTVTFANRALGSGIGIFKASVVIGLIGLIVVSAPWPASVAKVIYTSRTLRIIRDFKPTLFRILGKDNFLTGMFEKYEKLLDIAQLVQKPQVKEGLGNLLSDQKTPDKMTDFPQLRKIMQHPVIREIQTNPRIAEAIKKKDYAARFHDDGVNEKLESWEFVKLLLNEIELDKLKLLLNEIDLDKLKTEVEHLSGSGKVSNGVKTLRVPAETGVIEARVGKTPETNENPALADTLNSIKKIKEAGPKYEKIAFALSDKKFREELINDPEFQKILKLPFVQKIIADKRIRQAIEEGRYADLLDNKNFKAMIDSPRIDSFIQKKLKERSLKENSEKN